MRALAPLGLVVLLLAASVPAEARLFPQTREALRETAEVALDAAPLTPAEARAEARRLVAEVRGAIRQAPLELRVGLAQPLVEGLGDAYAVAYVGASSGLWRGAYWIESDASATNPTFVQATEEGVLLAVREGALPPGDGARVRYHFLGVDGRYQALPLGRVPVLAEAPAADAVEVGAAHATAGSDAHEARLLLTLWNLLGREATVGVSLHAGDETLLTYDAPACEAGCRPLVSLPFPSELTHARVWHLDADGREVSGRELTREQLLAGHSWQPTP